MDLNSDAWCDLVFEGKNRKYGAYYLRKTSSKRHLRALAIVAIFVIVLIALFFFIRLPQVSDNIKLKPMNISDLKMVEYAYVEEHVKPIEEKPLLKELTKFTPPDIVKEEEFEKKELAETHNIQPDTITFSEVLATEEDSILLQKLMHNKAQKDSIGVSDEEALQNEELRTLRTQILRYVYQNLKYPDVAYKQKIQGRVVCSFTVDEKGKVADVKLVKGVYIFLDEEAMRVLQSMPMVDPVKKDGKPIKVKYYVPIIFSL